MKVWFSAVWLCSQLALAQGDAPNRSEPGAPPDWAPPPSSVEPGAPPEPPPPASPEAPVTPLVQAVRPSKASHLTLSADVVAPTGGSYGPARLGYGGSAGMWLRTGPVVLDPRLSVHVGFGPSESRFIDVSTDFGVMWPLLEGPVSPVIGGGAGLRFLEIRGLLTVTNEGEVLRITRRNQPLESLFGFQGYLRTGMLITVNESVSLFTLIDGTVSLMSDQKTPASAIVSLGVAL